MPIKKWSIGGGALVGLMLAVWGCSESAGPLSVPAETADAPTRTASISPSKPTASEVQRAKSEATVPPPADGPAEFADPGPRGESKREAKNPAERAAATAPRPLEDAQAAELTMPQVSLAHGHAETCRVQVGDRLPDFQLADLEGHEYSLAKLLGAKLTVVLFWNASKPTALEELRDLGPDVLNRFSGNGVAVVSINTLDNPQLARELVSQAGARFPNLSDPQGEAFRQVATAKVPRTYLVDARGKILWFDFEYSRTTRRELVQAIRYLLTHK